MSKINGVKLPKKDIRDYKYCPDCISGVFLPKVYYTWVPPVKDQESVSSCAAHAAAEIVEVFDYLEHNRLNLRSAGYIYGCRYRYKGEGMFLRDVLKTLKNRGVSYYSEFPYNKEVPEIIALFNKKKEWTTDSNGQILTYFSVGDSVSKIKQAIYNKGPVLVSIPWYEDFKLDGNNKIYSPSDLKCDKGYHAVMVYGWDDNKQSWLFQNSWGKYWGNNGRALYPYNYDFREVWGLTDKEDKDIKKKKINWFTNIFYKLVNNILNLFMSKN